MSNTAIDFYRHLPSLYRIRDEERRGALKALLEILQEQANLIRLNIDDLYDDFFIETCAEWVVPYIGDLVANNPLYEVMSTRRADVARTLEYRHGKGTQRVLEQLARDVTGWSAHVVAFFELLQWSQNVNHIRLQAAKPNPGSPPGTYSFERVSTVDVRNYEVLDRFDGPFDSIAHSADVRPPEQASGWHNVHNAGFFLWRLESYKIPRIDARAVSDAAGEHRYHFSPVGNPTPLFHLPAGAPARALTREQDVHAPIRPAALFLSLNRFIYYGPGGSFLIRRDNALIPPNAICVMDLADWDRPEAGKVAVDVTRGRMTFATGEEPQFGVTATYTYGFSGDVGGGPYDRIATIVKEDENTTVINVPGDAATLANAITAALAAPTPRAVITLHDSRTFEEDLTIPIDTKVLIIQSVSTQRPTLHGDITVTGGSGRNSLTLSGLWISGGLRLEGFLSHLHILHTTLVPGRRIDENGAPLEAHLPSIFAADSNTELAMEITRSVVGAITAPSESLGITATDSILDSASRDTDALFLPALVSGVHNAAPVLSSLTPTLTVSVGALAPKTIGLNVAASLTDFAENLQKAIRDGNTPEEKNAIVVATDTRLVLLGGDGARIRVAPFQNDPTATELKLDEASSREVLALLGGLRETLTITDNAPELHFRADDGPPSTATFASVPATLEDAKDELTDAIADAEFEIVDNRILVIPGGTTRVMVFSGTAADTTTVHDVGLASVAAAIAGDDTGDITGPPVTLNETTVLGRMHVRQMDASNCILDQRVIVDRRQTGCVRFSYVAPLSRTPRRFRCQPDIDPNVEPSFTSRRWGDAGYAQLSLACPIEVRTGADDGSEMGAWHFLMQPQRETNLRVRLGEYLPFGLEAALIFVT